MRRNYYEAIFLMRKWARRDYAESSFLIQPGLTPKSAWFCFLGYILMSVSHSNLPILPKDCCDKGETQDPLWSYQFLPLSFLERKILWCVWIAQTKLVRKEKSYMKTQYHNWAWYKEILPRQHTSNKILPKLMATGFSLENHRSFLFLPD